jgi:hypothetical protein
MAGQKLPRGSIAFDADKAAAAFGELATKITDLPLLRTYWYDGTSTGPTPQHLSIAHLAGVKLRLGFVNSHGEQKGVDSLIVTDMIDLARNRAMSEAVLLSGDEDLRVGVQQAQQLGVRVHLVGIRPCRGSQSLFLMQEADSTTEWGPEDLQPFMSIKPVPDSSAPHATPVGTTMRGGARVRRVGTATRPSESSSPAATVMSSSGDEVLTIVAEEVAAMVPEADLAALIQVIEATGQTPRDFDRLLLGRGGSRLGVHLDSTQKNSVRILFLAACASRLAAAKNDAKK